MSKRRNPLADEADPTTTEMVVEGMRRGDREDEGFEPVSLLTSRGEIATRYYAAPGANAGAVVVGGAGGGFDTPVCGWLYPRLSEQLSRDDAIACLRVRYRHPNDLEECSLDVLAGVAFLESEGVNSVALVGHSFGGAVVIQAAAASEAVKTCVPMSTQTCGAEPAADLGPRCSLLLAHGTADEVLPPRCSQYVYRIAKEPKKLLLKEGARHGLDEWADELPGILRDWIRSKLRVPTPRGTR
jgi:alpha/beta superfamily hydrolase